MALALPIQSDPVQTRRKSNLYLDTHRPWLSLYGVRVRPVPPVGSLSSKPVCDPSLIHRLLPDELLYEVFARMPPYTLGRAAAVCRKWRYGIRSPALWRDACLRTWQMCGVQENERIVQSYYVGSWARMFRERPHLRFDGLYVSRNTYIRAGVAEWKITNPVHLVCYYRYIRFYPSGKFLYKNSSLKLKEVAKLFQGRALKAEAVYCGRYTLTKDQVEAAILYPGVWPTVLRIRIRIRGTVPGANNRLDLLSLVTIGVNDTEAVNREEDGFGTVEGLGDEENHNPNVPAVSHRRGLAPFVFVPFEEVDSSELNLPVDKMDYYVPG